MKNKTKKLSKRALTLLLALVLSFSLIMPSALAENENADTEDEEVVVDVDAETEVVEVTEEEDGTAVKDAEEPAEISDEGPDVEEESGNEIILLSDSDLSIVDAVNIESYTTGTAPFDDEEGAGNDTTANDNIVRSFDYIEYGVGYTTALKDTSAGSVEDGYLMIEFTLPVDPSVAEFNGYTLNWCDNQVVTYYYTDDTSSTVWDTGKTVEKQVLTGQHYLTNSGGQDAIPGSGTLSVGIYVKAASNGTQIRPTFVLYMEGNAEKEYKTIQPDAVTVTAAPRYNIRLYRNTLCNELGYFDLDSGTMSYENQSGSDIYGRIEGYGITVQLYNNNADLGLKGIELPTGKITFNVQLTTTVNGTDMTQKDGYHPLLWDYEEATAESTSKVGTLGRSMTAFGISRTSYALYTPGNKLGTTKSYCYDGGGWKVEQNDDYSLTVTLDGKYLFDTANFVFPEYGLGDTSTTPRFGANVGSFSAGYIEVIAAFPEDAAEESTQNFDFGVEVTDMAATSVSGQTAEEEMTYNDNKSSTTLTMYPSGSISKWNWYRSSSGGALDNDGSSQDGSCYGYRGESIEIASEIKYDGDTPLLGYNILQKFDDEALEVVPTAETGYDHYTNINDNNTYDSVTVLYAAKTNKTGWESDTEMMEAKEENLIYFTSLNALEKAGYTCVGFLYEVRGTFYAMPGTGNYIYMKMNILDDAVIGSVYQTVNTIRAWEINTKAPISWTSVSYGSDGACGWGNTSWIQGSSAYYEEYTTPDYRASHEEDYAKSVYNNGSKSGHTNANQAGDSLLIIGDKTEVTIEVADDQTIYDLDQGQRTVMYEVTPKIMATSENRETESSGDTDNVTLTITLPKGLTYDMDSAEIDPESITKNDDGTTTIIWYFKDVPVSTESLSAFTFTCTIGEAGTSEDVQNNDTLTVRAEITADKDERENKSIFNNLSETTISVIRLAGSSISKSTESELTELGQDITFYLRYGNSSNSDQIDDELLDILPYNGDGRGTSFSGTYQVASVTVDLSQAPNTWDADWKDGSSDVVYIEYTKDTTVRDLSTEQISALLEANVEKDELGYGFETLHQDGKAHSDNVNKTITWYLYDELEITDVKALYIRLNDVFPNEYITVSITLSVENQNGSLLPDEEGNIEDVGDKYANDFYQYYLNEAGVVTSNIAASTIVKRDITGLSWIDADADGIRAEDEELLSGATVTLYRTTKSQYDPRSGDRADMTIDNQPLYRAYNVVGDEVNTVKTLADLSTGEYEFEKLESGTYYVVFDNIPSGYGMTACNVGSDSTDSDAYGFINSSYTGVSLAYIPDIVLPALEDMTSWLYESEHNDIGVVNPVTSLGIQKVDGYNQYLSGAEFTLTASNGNAETVVTDEFGRASFNGLGVGTYTLTETKAPNGYQLSDKVYPITVLLSDNGDEAWTAEMTADIADIQDGLYIIANESFTTSITVTKVWNDDNNRDGKRSDAEFALTGTADGDTVVTQTGTIKKDADPATYTWEDLPIYYGETKIEYSVIETSGADGYQVTYGDMTYSDNNGYVITVTNSYDVETTSLTIDKQWVDANNATGLRPSAITVTLTGTVGNETVVTDTQTITANDGWTYTFDNLYVYDNGNKIDYAITEESVDYYETDIDSTANGWTITNTQNIFPGEFVLNKVDDLGSTINGAQFTLTDNNGNAVQFDVDGDIYTVSDTGTTSVIDAGNVTIEMLMPGTYTLTETNVPDGYEGMSGSITVTVANDGTVTYSEANSTSLLGTIAKAFDSAWASVKTFFINLFSGKNIQDDIVTLAENDSPIHKYINGGESYYSNDDDNEIVTYTIEYTNNTDETVTIVITDTLAKDLSYVLINDNGTYIDGTITWVIENVEPEQSGAVSFEAVNIRAVPEYSENIIENFATVVIGNTTYYTNTTFWDVYRDGDDVSSGSSEDLIITKVWDDEGHENERPTSIVLYFREYYNEVRTVTLSESNNWTNMVSLYDGTCNEAKRSGIGGKDNRYALNIWEESNGEYTLSFGEITQVGSTYYLNAINTYDVEEEPEPEPVPEPDMTVIEVVNHKLTSVTVDKTWDDDSNRDGIRPTEIIVNLYADGAKVDSATVTATDGWTHTFTDLPAYNNGQEITYTVSEVAVNGYTNNVTGSMDSGYIITNTHTPETISITGNKTWNDNNNQDGVRPSEVTIILFADGDEVDRTTVTGSDNWEYTFDGLNKYRDGGIEIVYTVNEIPVDDYTTDIDGNNVTNTHVPETVSVSGTKVWIDNNNQDGIRPSSITINLFADEEKIDSKSVTASDNWSYTFENLPKYRDGGIEIVYTVTEDEVSGYTGETSGTDFTNTHTPYTIDIPVEKIWDDNNNRDNIRPNSIDVTLTGSDGNTYPATLSEENDWSYTFTDLPVNYNEGTLIGYELTETVPDGYSAVITSSDDGYEITIKNSHEPELTEVPVEKAWNDNDDALGYRPEEIEVTLTGTADGETFYEKTVTLTEDNDWAYLFEDLFVYENGKEIIYTVSEAPVIDYYTDIDGNMADGYEITNTVIDPKLDKELVEDDYARKEADGSTMHDGEDTYGDGWGIWDDVDNNQDVTFKLTLTDIKSAVNLTVHDYLDNGLDFELDTVDVTLYDGEDEIVLENDVDYTVSEDKCTDPDCTMDGCTFEISFADEVFDGVSPDAYIIVTYKALTDTHADDYIDYVDKIYNEAYILYGVSEMNHRSAVVITETDLFGFEAYKYVNEDGELVGLEGAEFVLSYNDSYGVFETEEGSDGDVYYILTGWTSDIKNAGIITSGSDGIIHVEGLDDDTYTLTETVAPVGYYELEEPVTFTIDEDGTVTGDTVMADDDYTVVGIENEKILTSVTGTKTWVDNDDQDGIRPDGITIRLYADGEEVDSMLITAEDDWTYTFSDLVAYNDGIEIEYTITEDEVDGYVTEYNGYDVVNTHEPETTSIDVVKVWNDEDNADGIRPGRVTVILTADGQMTGYYLELTESNDWTGTFKNLDVYADGNAIEYGIYEVDVDGYTSATSGNAEDGFVLTNTHAVTGKETTSDNGGTTDGNGGKSTKNGGTTTTSTEPDYGGKSGDVTGNVKTGEIIGISTAGIVGLGALAGIIGTVVSRKRKGKENA